MSEPYGARSYRLLHFAVARGMRLDNEGRVVLPSGKIHESTPWRHRRHVNLSIDGERVKVATARVVCFLAHGPPPMPSCVVDHIDGDTLNDHPDNLRWATASENTRNTALNRSRSWEERAALACAGMEDPVAEIARLRNIETAYAAEKQT